MTNQQVAQILRNVAAAYTIKDEKKFRFQIIAYQKAADSIGNLTKEVVDLYREKKLNQIPGVGLSIQSHIEELLRTGKVKHFDWVTKGIPKTVFPLLEIPTFGPKKAYRLAKEFELKNPETVIEDLGDIAKKGKIAKIPGFGEKSEADILRALYEYKQGRAKTSRMVLPYAWELAEKIISYLTKSKDVIAAYPLGSLRRMVSTVGDIDIAVSTKKQKEVIDYFVSYPSRDRLLEKGPTTASIIINSGRQVDLMTKPPESFGSLLQHFTGSKNHNIALREYALKRGFSLSEYGIKEKTKNGKWHELKFDTEQKFYNEIGMDWIPPEIRENTGEIEQAVKHELPKLVELKDIKGDLHIHSHFPIEPSHDMGQNTMEELLKKGKELKYEYLGFSEHNPSVSKHSNNQIYSILSRRREIIEQINKSTKDIRAINLLEVDILATGKLSLDDKALSLIDAAIVGIHSSLNMNKTEMTKRILAGLSHPKVRIFAHPTGRLLETRTAYELDFEKLFEFCKKNNKALEINAWPARLDLPDTMVREAVKQKIKLVINTDSHNVSQLELMRYGVSVARRGWAEKNDILNTLEYNKFIDWLKS